MLADQAGNSEMDVLEANLRIRPKPQFHVAVYQNVLRFARTKPLAFSGGTVLAIMIVIAFLTRYAGLAPYDPEQIGVATKFGAPGADVVLGTDQLGRDVLSRLMYGTWVSL
jgi:peptide/nickel transport system permease protein